MEKEVTKRSLKDHKNDYSFWLTKTPAEGIAAVELLGQHYISFLKDVPQRLQRVVRIIDKKTH